MQYTDRQKHEERGDHPDWELYKEPIPPHKIRVHLPPAFLSPFDTEPFNRKNYTLLCMKVNDTVGAYPALYF